MSHINDQRLAEIDQILRDELPEGERYILVTSEPSPPDPNQTDYSVVANVDPPEAKEMLDHITNAIEANMTDEPPIPWAG